MIVLNSGANTVALTLTERTTISPAYYLFAITSFQTKQTKYFTGTDISSYKERYNKFIFTLVGSVGAENLLNSTFYLPNEGIYYYEVFQQSSATNLNPLNTGASVEVGTLKINYSEDSSIIYTPNSGLIIAYGQ
jgi:hypothetical protein